MINIYTDGSSQGNPGNGGYGAILEFQGKRKELSQGFRKTTNNRMELLAVIAALEALKKENLNITVYSDSKYVVDAIEKKWLDGWVKTGFKKKKNPDLWRRYLEASKGHNIKYIWLKGHAGHPQNERCDQLAVAAAQSYDLLIDEGYENDENSLF